MKKLKFMAIVAIAAMFTVSCGSKNSNSIADSSTDVKPAIPNDLMIDGVPFGYDRDFPIVDLKDFDKTWDMTPNEVWVVEKNGKRGVVRKLDNKLIVSLEYDLIVFPFGDEGNTYITLQKGEEGKPNCRKTVANMTTGKKLFEDKEFIIAGHIKGEDAFAYETVSGEEGVYYYDGTKYSTPDKLSIEPKGDGYVVKTDGKSTEKYDEIKPWPLRPYHFYARKGNKWGGIHYTGKVTIPFEYDDCFPDAAGSIAAPYVTFIKKELSPEQVEYYKIYYPESLGQDKYYFSLNCIGGYAPIEKVDQSFFDEHYAQKSDEKYIRIWRENGGKGVKPTLRSKKYKNFDWSME